MNINRTKLGKYIKKNDLKTGDSVHDLIMSVSGATCNKWALANWITHRGVYVVESCAVDQAKSGTAAPKINHPWSPDVIANVDERKAAVNKALVDEMTKRGYRCGKNGRSETTVDYLDDVYTDFSIIEEWRAGYRKSGKLRIQYRDGGLYGSRQQRPEPNKGFDIKTICNDLERYVEVSAQRSARHDQEADNMDTTRAMADAINEKLGLNKYGDVRAKGTGRLADKVLVEIKLYLNPDDAEALLSMAQGVQ